MRRREKSEDKKEGDRMEGEGPILKLNFGKAQAKKDPTYVATSCAQGSSM